MIFMNWFDMVKKNPARDTTAVRRTESESEVQESACSAESLRTACSCSIKFMIILISESHCGSAQCKNAVLKLPE